HLPGERSLATSLQIGRDTVRIALAELEKQGWISARAHGKRRKILKQKSAKAPKKRQHRIGFLSPRRLEELVPTMLIEVDRLREMLARQNITLDIHTPSIFTNKRPGHRLRELIDSTNCDAWILYQSSEEIQLWFEKENIPCIVRGYPYPGIQLPSLDIDWQAAGLHAGALLLRKGHRSIGLMMPDTQLQGLFAAQKGLENALAQESDETHLHCMTDHGTTEGVASALHTVLATENPPTAIIATRTRQVLTLISWLATHGFRVPNNISLVSLTHDNIYEALLPKIDYYTLDSNTMARNMTRRLESLVKGVGKDQKVLIPEYFPGASISKC
ncbi:MAG: substrate-binding domain-containing protein, partial [Akkermansiaceae bacterium]